MADSPKPLFPPQQQPVPGATALMTPRPDHGEDSYRGTGRLRDKKVLLTGGDSGIGRAVALAFAREGADLLIAYLDEDDDAREMQRLVEEARRQCVLAPGTLPIPGISASWPKRRWALSGVSMCWSTTPRQMSFNSPDEISDEEWERAFAVNISAMFYLTKAALPHMPPGSAIINTASINADSPSPHLLAYATTKGAIQNFTAGLAQLLAEKGIRVNAVAPGPVWTPLIPSTMPPDAIAHFGEQVPMKRPAQPREVAPVYVLLASDEASYVSGTMVAVTGGKPISRR
jgi:NAD(P)-dependent dehydrogenase (short-subunit alcohol dehydrogenase family)